jgi:hypothetical protein
MGARLRLKTNVAGQDPALRTADPNVRKIFRAMQKYGLIVADNGSDMYITGTFDTRWRNDILNPAFATLSASDFDVIQLGWKPAATAPALGSLTTSPASVVGGLPATGTVTLTAIAPAGGALVSLSSASTAIAVPANVSVAQGTNAATFGIATSAVPTLTSATISAAYNGSSKTAVLTVMPAAAPSLATLTLDRASVVGGTSFMATVTLTAPAPVGGATVGMTSSRPSLAAPPANVVVLAGATTATALVMTGRTRHTANVTISASYASVTKSATITVMPR